MAGIIDVAREAGVSRTTVSRYINKHIELPAATGDRIDAAIKRLNYRPNLLAKSLSTGRSDLIGVVAPDISNPFFGKLISAIEDEAEKHGYSVLVSNSRGLRSKEMELITRLEDRHVDGLILMTNISDDDGALATFLAKYTNVMLLDEDVVGFIGSRGFVENEQGAWHATQYLIEAGHRCIGHIGGPEGLMSTKERLAGYTRAMHENGLDAGKVFLGAHTREFGAVATEQLLNGSDMPTAIFAGSDFLALGVMQKVRERGLRLPEDISLLGFDDMPFADLLAPPLTTIRQPDQELGRRAFLAVLGAINKHPPMTERLPTSLVERQSVARLVGMPIRAPDTA